MLFSEIIMSKDSRRNVITGARCSRERVVKNVVTSADRAALEDHYSFIPSESTRSKNNTVTNEWQERMVTKYHDHLFKEFALADLSIPGRIGLRWRTREEVINGRGDRTCGNKRCPNNSDDTNSSLLVTLEVPFSYYERGEKKMELVKLKLCSSCKKDSFDDREKRKQKASTHSTGQRENEQQKKRGQKDKIPKREEGKEKKRRRKHIL